MKILIIDNITNESAEVNRNVNKIVSSLNAYDGKRIQAKLLNSYTKGRGEIIHHSNDYNYFFIGANLPMYDNQRSLISHAGIDLLRVMEESQIYVPTFVFANENDTILISKYDFVVKSLPYGAFDAEKDIATIEYANEKTFVKVPSKKR